MIALSPHAESGGTDIDTRYQNINIPVLSVTSNSDDETHGNDPVSLHQIPFQHMPPENKYLLLLTAASHALIGDGDTSNDVQNENEVTASKPNPKTPASYAAAAGITENKVHARERMEVRLQDAAKSGLRHNGQK